METQEKLFHDIRSNFKSVTPLQKNKLSLEQEREKFIRDMCNFIDPLNFNQLQLTGRPKTNLKDIVKGLLIMSFHGMSYRRANSDIMRMYGEGLIKSILPKSTLNNYANCENIIDLIGRLIQISALFFNDNENCLIIDSTWFATRMYIGGHKRVHDKKNCNFEQTRKLHMGCLKNSQVIACAIAGEGKAGDSPKFKEIVENVVENGFRIKTVLADAGYSSKNNYSLCRDLGIFEVYIDFKSNASIKRAKSDIWKEKLKLFKEQKEVWHDVYRYRVIIEGVFSSIKRKQLNYLRSRNPIAQDCELLLKCLVHNICIIGKYS